MKKTIIYSGSAIGTVDNFIEFWDALWKYIEKKNDYLGEREKGILNCLIHQRKFLKDFLIIKDNHGPVMTVGLSKRENLFLDNDDNMLNYDGQVASVIHQYDKLIN